MYGLKFSTTLPPFRQTNERDHGVERAHVRREIAPHWETESAITKQSFEQTDLTVKRLN